MPIPVVQEVKFLGIIFDSKLSFLPHIRYVKNKCTKALNLIRVVAHTSCGTDQDTLLLLYTSLIRSKLDYGCIAYGSARSSYLRMLDPVQNHALRLCLGAYRTSPLSSLCVLANFISRVLFSPPSPTSELRDRQLCGVVVNRLQIVIMDTTRLYSSWSASVRSYRILMWTGPTGANLHDRCHDLSESGSA